MTASPPQVLTLEEFLKLPYVEDSPAWEYMNGVAIQKPMPKTRHSILQKRLLQEVDSHSSDYTALPELRCTFGGRSVVPDIAVVAWNQIQINESGEPEDNFTQAPDWAIEILSPDQKATRVIDNLLHCLKHGCELGWMLDPDDYSVLVLAPQQEVDIVRGDRQLPVIQGVNLSITAEQVFTWLKISRR
jgi:Uma2 family endonuclease